MDDAARARDPSFTFTTFLKVPYVWAVSATTTAHLSDEVRWSHQVGGRLKLIQASCADDSESARCDHLAEQLEREIRDLAPGKRRAFLQALEEQFPAWEAAPGAAAQRPVEEAPDALANRLAEMAPYLSTEQKKALGEHLHDSGFAVAQRVPVASAGTPPQFQEVPVELQRKLGVDTGGSLDPDRVLRLIAVLADLAVTLDQVAWNVWKSLAPKSPVRREGGAAGDFRRIGGPYLLGDKEVSTAQINLVIDKTRQLIAGLLAAIGATGETFARQHLARFSPDAIKQLAEEESGFFVGPEQKCWRKYVALFNELSGLKVEKEISAGIVKYAEDLILGGARSAGAGD